MRIHKKNPARNIIAPVPINVAVIAGTPPIVTAVGPVSTRTIASGSYIVPIPTNIVINPITIKTIGIIGEGLRASIFHHQDGLLIFEI